MSQCQAWWCLAIAIGGCSPWVDRLSVAPSREGFERLGCHWVEAPGGLTAPERRWTQLEAAQRERQGRQAWRTPGPQGFSCAHCHAPEPLDFALTSITDDAVQAHASHFAVPPVVDDVVGLIHWLRRTHQLEKVCQWPFRPYQPQGEVLEGGDAAFSAQLAARGLRLMSRVDTLDDALEAWAELQALDVSSVPLAVALPPLSQSASLNDWMTFAPPVGRDEALFALHDAVLETRSEQAGNALSNFLLEFAATPANFPPPPGLSPRWLRTITATKQAAATWLFLDLSRRLRGEEPLADPGLWRAVAVENDVDPCAGDDACGLAALSLLPGKLATDHPQEATTESAAPELSMGWGLLAFARDPATLRFPSSTAPGGFHYARTWAFDPNHRAALEPFVVAVRLAAQQRAWAPFLAGKGPAPTSLVRAPPPAVRSLLLDGGWVLLPRWRTTVLTFSDDHWLQSLTLRLNLLRAVLLVQREELAKGASVADRFTLELTLTDFEDFISEARALHLQRLRLGQTSLSTPSAEVLFDDTLRVLTQVFEAQARAPEVMVPRALSPPEP